MLEMQPLSTLSTKSTVSDRLAPLQLARHVSEGARCIAVGLGAGGLRLFGDQAGAS